MSRDKTDIERRLDVLGVNFRTLGRFTVSETERAELLTQALAVEKARADQATNAAEADVRRRLAAAAPRAQEAMRGRAAVVSWDMGHNPAGRAIVLYDLLSKEWDTELIGPLWSRYGGKIWSPIARSDRKMRGFPCDTLEQFWPSVLGLAATARYDVVVICKPRLPAILLGTALARASNCPIVLDVDDFELSFFKDETAASLDELEARLPEALIEPYEELATRAAESVIHEVPSIIVSNVALRKRYGGIVVRHARDEATFNPDAYDRLTARARMGIAPDDFALVFVGTPRRHKGVLDVARVLNDMTDKRFVLHLVGEMTDKRDLRELESYQNARVIRHPNCEFDELPGIIVAGDAVVLLQDPTHPVSSYQIPAKISDAAGFGVPIVMTNVPPVRDLIELGLITVTDAENLADTLTNLRNERDRFPSGSRPAIRAAFESELSFAVNGARLQLAVDRAVQARTTAIPPAFDRLFDMAGRAYAGLRARSHRSSVLPAAPREGGYDMVMFWKQNDSGLYGRRSDMLMKQFLISGRVRRVLQFDAPQEMVDLTRLADNQAGPRSAQLLSLANIIDDRLALRDNDRYRLRSFLWARNRPAHPVFSGAGTSLIDYPAWVERQIREAGIVPEQAISWVCPVVFDFPAIAKAIPFRARIGDLIDDQRAFDMQPSYRRRIEQSYEDTLPLLDLTFTNCTPLADAFRGLTGPIHVVPNGTELPEPGAPQVPDLLARLGRPLIGYVGNLRDRIDWTLLHGTALLMPDATFVVVGGGERPEEVAELRQLPNVVFTGVVPYAQVMPVIQSFDVAIMPHLRSGLTNRMNPLKIYNYFAARRPIVSTQVENIDEALKPFIRFAHDPVAFAGAISQSLADPPVARAGYNAALESITWESRALTILDHLDGWLAAGIR